MGSELHVRHLSGAEKDEEHTFREFPVRIGRAEECQLRFDPQQETTVSAVHAEVRLENGDFHVFDMESRNGLFLDGKRIEGSEGLPARATLEVGKGGPKLELLAREGGSGVSFSDVRRKTESGREHTGPLIATDDSFDAYSDEELDVVEASKGLNPLWIAVGVIVVLGALGGVAYFAF